MTLETLDIPRPASRPRYDAERTLSNASFWRGAAATRLALYRTDPSLANARGILRVERIEAALAKGHPLAAIPDFSDWLNAARPSSAKGQAA